MRNFYIRLALSNVKKNKPVYYPFFLTNILSVMIFFCMASIQNQTIIATLPGSYIFVQFLKVGVVMTGIFAGVFLLYTNGLLIRQRKKELGLYTIFGLEKKHIAKVLILESMLLTTAGLVAGIVLGIVLGKLFFLVLLKLLHLDSGLTFQFLTEALVQTGICFIVIGVFILFYNLFSVMKAKPVELLYAAHKGDNYHPFVGLKAFLGILCIGGAYALILTTPSPIDIIGRVFPIALLILVGTLFFFSSCSVVLLQALKKNDSYYYKPENFISVSGLIYRLKQNAKGLSNICILSTVVMVIATTTLALYVGQKEMISFRFPMETKISVSDIADGQPALPQFVHKTAEQYDMEISREADYNVTYISGVYKDNTISVYQPDIYPPDMTCGIYLITWEDYSRMEEGAEPLEADEVFVFSSSKDLGVSEISFDSLKYRVKAELSELAIQSKSVLSSETHYYIICPMQKDIGNILAELSPAENKFSQTYNMMFDAEGGQETDFNAALQNQLGSSYAGAKYENAETKRQSDNFTYGGFLFIGLLLSLLFMIFLALVIYYKQITEGYSDRYNFEVMQKVGLDRNEVSAIVHKEIRTMFFLPLLIAVIHLAVSLYAVAMLIAVFGLTNVLVLLLCAGTISLLFAFIYMVMYFSTAKTYCKIVMR
ncbi:ABC transporter permease protein YxdM [Acetatifactor muris]|uniref:ABC transporter permease protein YxdM n=4 Tax=Lachnospiraceae TaxID=186803 RepID=A0A2K4ZL54_9FIRM|nr:ABC transporter permease [bacterium D16-50]GFI16449.1 ABC transporter permease protein YxdM [Lachnospiraceae bacterium]SOY31217.1 ABC transporter permease protein YxdM [Acetatifactor muris]